MPKYSVDIEASIEVEAPDARGAVDIALNTVFKPDNEAVSELHPADATAYDDDDEDDDDEDDDDEDDDDEDDDA